MRREQLTFLHQSLTADPPVHFPHLTQTNELEAQGLVIHDPKGVTFCKNWSSVNMYSFLEQHLPRPFQYFKEQGLNRPTRSKPNNLPFCILERSEDRRFSVVNLPQNGPTGKFYQSKATGPKGASFKNRNIVLSQSNVPMFQSPEHSHTFQSQSGQSLGVYLVDGGRIPSLLGRISAIWKLMVTPTNKHAVPARRGQSRKKV